MRGVWKSEEVLLLLRELLRQISREGRELENSKKLYIVINVFKDVHTNLTNNLKRLQKTIYHTLFNLHGECSLQSGA